MVKDVVSFPDFAKLDLRVGKVLDAQNVEGSKNLIRMEVDLGPDYGIHKIFSGVAKWYKPSQLKGKKFIFLANLLPKQMMKEMSEGMVLCADTGGEAILIPVNSKVPEGSVVR